ncbi:MAG TPA: hypothetical protein VK925_08280 [Jiangellaceae bacterium]|nr:hypothetical protein [Jiangellaceae bacterium]
MGYSGLIYAAIVACWAAFLVPRWIRRNEEVERAREEDAARGVRVLERDQRAAGSSHSGFRFEHPVGERVGAALTNGPPVKARAPAGPAPEPADEVPAAEIVQTSEFSVAARRRRRVLTVLVLVLAGVTAAVLGGVLPAPAVLAPLLLLAGFLVLARRAAIAEARCRARLRRLARRRTELAAHPAADKSRPGVAVLDEPAPAEPVDPNAWQPVPVPLPTYLTKAKAEPPLVRKIDLSSPGAWTSGRLNPASSIALPQRPPQRPAHDAELPEHRRAVGD